MAKIAARNASLGLHDTDATNTCRPLSSFMNNIALNYTAEAPEITSFGDEVRVRQHNGIKDVELTFDAFFGTGAAETDAILFGLLGTCTHFSFGPSGSATGAVRYSASAVLTAYNMTFALADAGQCTGTLVLRTGSLTRTTWG